MERGFACEHSDSAEMAKRLAAGHGLMHTDADKCPACGGSGEHGFVMWDLPAKWADLDGMIHIAGGDCCSEERKCPKCGSRQHAQGCYGGLMLHCESCDEWNAGPAPEEEDIEANKLSIRESLRIPLPNPHPHGFIDALAPENLVRIETTPAPYPQPGPLKILTSDGTFVGKPIEDRDVKPENVFVVADWPKDALAEDRKVERPGEGHAWIQWKGTNVCMDVWCRCGAHGHIDAEFAYYYTCAHCKTTFVVGQTVRLYAMTPELEAKTVEQSSCIVTDPDCHPPEKEKTDADR